MPSEYVELTTHLIKSADPPDTGQRFIRDTLIAGLALRITERGAKAFVVETWINGRSRRLTLGKFPKLSLKDARKKARKELGQFASGTDLVAERQDARTRNVTLEEVFESYLKGRDLKPGTVKDYRRVMREAFEEWKPVAITSITRDMVERRHKRLGESSQARANNAMRVLRALFNYAIEKYEDSLGRPIILDNPVRRLSATRRWYRVDRRQSVIKPHRLKRWFAAVQRVRSSETGRAQVAADYLLFLLFTGLRREEAARLKRQDVDLKQKTFRIIDTKNRQIHELPLSDYLVDLVRACRKVSKKEGSEFLFPGDGPKGHIVSIRRWKERVIDESGVPFSLHDLRRTFSTIAESLDIPTYALKRLLNHKMREDVTAGYVVMDTERLRAPMQRITDYILATVDVERAGKVVQLRAEAQAADGNT